MSLTESQISNLMLQVEQSEVRVFHYQTPDFEIYISKSDDQRETSGLSTARPHLAQTGRPHASMEHPESKEHPEQKEPVDDDVDTTRTDVADDVVVVEAPMIGVFYRSSQPDAPPFVEIGAELSRGDTVGLVEAMKLFTAVSAEVSGTVIEILVENGAYVEYGQPLLHVRVNR